MVLSASWHLITGEFPPACGGVSDYTHALSGALAAAGDDVHVWCPAVSGTPATPNGVRVHRVAGHWTAADLAAAGIELDRLAGPRRLLVQWVPHAYGNRSLNVGFCRWIRQRGRLGDVVDLMVHEPFLGFREGTIRQDAAAVVQRGMIAALLSVARRVWVAIPGWVEVLRPWTLTRDVSFCWLPVPSNVPVVQDPGEVMALRARIAGDSTFVIGHFGTYGDQICRDLQAVLPAVLDQLPDSHVLLLGRGGEAFAEHLRARTTRAAHRITASGGVASAKVSLYLQACDLLVQPYVDGVSSRRGTMMAALAHGVPTVTTTGRLTERLWASSGATRLVAADDMKALAGAVVELAGDAGGRERYATAARALYGTHFDLSRTVTALRSDTCQACEAI